MAAAAASEAPAVVLRPVRRTVDVEMFEMGFRPGTLAVRRGDTVTFRFANAGLIAHDAVVGDEATQDQHEAEMQRAAGDGHGHSHADNKALLLAPKTSGSLTYTFDKAGRVEVGCHQPGHYAAGMRMTVTVT